MANEFNRESVIQGRTASDAQIDEGLRSYMLRVYNYMTIGLVLTGLTAYVVSSTPALLQLFYAQNALGQLQPTMLAYVAMFSPFAFILALSFGIQRMSASTAQLVFWLFAAVMGLSMSHIFLTFTGASITRVFFITASTFAAMSLYGYTTKRDLSGLGSFLFMGLIGIILASIVNIFIGSTVMQFAISVIGVLVFVGLTAYDTQKIKEMYDELDGSEVAGKKAIMGALRLYLDFINLFMMLLHLFGNRE
jgi:FtsH-binding integral membrane protein